jgi:hypothetical protein
MQCVPVLSTDITLDVNLPLGELPLFVFWIYLLRSYLFQTRVCNVNFYTEQS